jgi:DNA polymerase-4
VMHKDFVSPIKSVGHGITCTADLNNSQEVWHVMLELSQDIGNRLRIHKLAATGVQISVRDNGLQFKQYQAALGTTTQSAMEIATKAREIFDANYPWGQKVRAVTVRAINLTEANTPHQTSLYMDPAALMKREKLDDTVEEIRRRFGKKAIVNASLLGDIKMPGHSAYDIVMPGMMYK